MKTLDSIKRILRPRRASVAALLLLSSHGSPLAVSCFAQGGSLTPPPGIPGPTMRSLQEIYDRSGDVLTQGAATQALVNALQDDDRTPISSAPFTITAAGSYYLTGNLAVTTGTAVTISADHVTLDLNGFTISSTASPASGSGVLVSGNRRNIRVANGCITGATTVLGGTFTPGGFITGLSCPGTSSRGIHISGLRVSGIAGDGISVDAYSNPGSIVEGCTVWICAGDGIVAHSTRGSAAADCGDIGVRGVSVSGSAGASVGASTADHGISATAVSNCKGAGGAGNGISATSVTGSHGSSTSGNGIGSDGLVATSIGVSSTGVGVNAYVVAACKGASTSSFGISAVETVSDSSGSSTGSNGIHASGNVCSSTGKSSGGIGIFCEGSVTSSYGESVTGNAGIQALGTASFCRGKRDGFTAITAPVAIGCTVTGTGTIISAQKHLGTP